VQQNTGEEILGPSKNKSGTKSKNKNEEKIDKKHRRRVA
jgi:hypothetical protein